jgi:hypothetical protein
LVRSELAIRLVKEFLEAGKRGLAGDTARAATSGEVKDLRRQAQELKTVVAEQALELRLMSRKMIGKKRIGCSTIALLVIVSMGRASCRPIPHARQRGCGNPGGYAPMTEQAKARAGAMRRHSGTPLRHWTVIIPSSALNRNCVA